jgi:rhamnose utilization protein RhaD (predicted bifunctional aldolase and dehydrogenase)
MVLGLVLAGTQRGAVQRRQACEGTVLREYGLVVYGDQVKSSHGHAIGSD